MLPRPNSLKRFLEQESASGILLFAAAVIAMIWANSPLAYIHYQFVDASLFWINEGLMAVFFLIVGLELKRSFLQGELSKPAQIILPAVAAVGGMVVPALIYAAINYHNPVTIKGWATPTATDIAFALGTLSLFGKRIPNVLKLFLMALAIFDDIGAILIIAVFYSRELSYLLLFQSAVLALILYLFNRLNVRSLLAYLLVGAWLWLALLHSGVHPTVAGIILAVMVPIDSNTAKSPLHRLEHMLHPWVAFLIMPLFALANAGFSLQGQSLTVLTDVVVLGIMLGLFIGKPIGVFGFTWLFIKMRCGALPKNVSWSQLCGVAWICGIGFTMSLFLGTLAFQTQSNYLMEVRLGVIMGSLMSGLMGAFILFLALTKKKT